MENKENKNNRNTNVNTVNTVNNLVDMSDIRTVRSIIAQPSVKADLSKYTIGTDSIRYIGERNTKCGVSFHVYFSTLVTSGIYQDMGVWFFLYHDGSNFRGYIPTRGNAVDADSKCAIGIKKEDGKLFAAYVQNRVNIRRSTDLNMCISEFEETLASVVSNAAKTIKTSNTVYYAVAPSGFSSSTYILILSDSKKSVVSDYGFSELAASKIINEMEGVDDLRPARNVQKDGVYEIEMDLQEENADIVKKLIKKAFPDWVNSKTLLDIIDPMEGVDWDLVKDPATGFYDLVFGRFGKRCNEPYFLKSIYNTFRYALCSNGQEVANLFSNDKSIEYAIIPKRKCRVDSLTDTFAVRVDMLIDRICLNDGDNVGNVYVFAEAFAKAHPNWKRAHYEPEYTVPQNVTYAIESCAINGTEGFSNRTEMNGRHFNVCLFIGHNNIFVDDRNYLSNVIELIRKVVGVFHFEEIETSKHFRNIPQGSVFLVEKMQSVSGALDLNDVEYIEAKLKDAFQQWTENEILLDIAEAHNLNKNPMCRCCHCC